MSFGTCTHLLHTIEKIKTALHVENKTVNIIICMCGVIAMCLGPHWKQCVRASWLAMPVSDLYLLVCVSCHVHLFGWATHLSCWKVMPSPSAPASIAEPLSACGTALGVYLPAMCS